MKQKRIFNLSIREIGLFLTLFILLLVYSMSVPLFTNRGLLTSGNPLWILSMWTTVKLLGCTGWHCVSVALVILLIYTAIFAGIGVVIIRQIRRRMA